MKASDWISVKDRLPKNGERVLVLREYNGEQIVDVAIRTRWHWKEDCLDCDNVTHWQPIVLPKKEYL